MDAFVEQYVGRVLGESLGDVTERERIPLFISAHEKYNYICPVFMYII